MLMSVTSCGSTKPLIVFVVGDKERGRGGGVEEKIDERSEVSTLTRFPLVTKMTVYKLIIIK